MPDNAAPTPLNPATLSAALNDLPLWRLDAEGKALRRDIRFADFSAAFAFMTRVAMLAEIAGHHPDWSNVYNRVSIALSTHDAKGVTERDLALARRIDALE
jgi:4a-hydroxytetrahydrobiopterin dehydratase